MSKLKILVVDDDKDFAETMADVLESQGFHVDLAYSGEEAVSKFRDTDYEICFLDVMLPGMNGVKSFLEIQKIEPNVRVVMMTGFSVENLLEQAVGNGALAVLHKPIDMKEVLKIVVSTKPRGIVLIADDDKSSCVVIRESLERRGYKVEMVHDGQSAVDRIREKGVDVLLLDLKMPVLDGLETYLELERTGDSVSTIVITGYATDKSDALSTLCSQSIKNVLTKPFDLKVLLQLVGDVTSDTRETRND